MPGRIACSNVISIVYHLSVESPRRRRGGTFGPEYIHTHIIIADCAPKLKRQHCDRDVPEMCGRKRERSFAALRMTGWEAPKRCHPERSEGSVQIGFGQRLDVPAAFCNGPNANPSRTGGRTGIWRACPQPCPDRGPSGASHSGCEAGDWAPGERGRYGGRFLGCP